MSATKHGAVCEVGHYSLSCHGLVADVTGKSA